MIRAVRRQAKLECVLLIVAESQSFVDFLYVIVVDHIHELVDSLANHGRVSF